MKKRSSEVERRKEERGGEDGRRGEVKRRRHMPISVDVVLSSVVVASTDSVAVSPVLSVDKLGGSHLTL